MLNLKLFALQRFSALIMIPLVLGHIAVMIYASRNGLSSAEILGRTRGSLFWGLFYGLFVLAISMHAAIGLRVIVFETFKIGKTPLFVFTLAVFSILLIMGGRAVYAVTAA